MLEAYRTLGVHLRLGALGALAVAFSLFLPWYGLPLSGGILQTGFAAFGWATAALLLTVGAALVMLYERARGRILPTPLHEGTLLVIGGAWSALLIVYLMIDRPNFNVAHIDRPYNLRYGIFLAVAGATLMILAGLRERTASPRVKPRAGRSPGRKAGPRSSQ